MNTLPTPTSHPAEVIQISPEALEVANTYLTCQSISETAKTLGIAEDTVSSYLGRTEVRSYVDQIFLDLGFNNRFKMRAAMDALIQRKFRELDESDQGSTKDIAELLEMSQKMTLAILDREIALKKLEQGSLKTQVNVQVNEATNYSSLIDKLINNNL